MNRFDLFLEEEMTQKLNHTQEITLKKFHQLELRLMDAAAAIVEIYFPPADSPAEALMDAHKRQEELTHSQLVTLVIEVRRILTEFGRHNRWLSEQSPVNSWHALPRDLDVLILMSQSLDKYTPGSLEYAQELEIRSRMAQKVFQAVAKGLPLPEGYVIVSTQADSPASVTDRNPKDSSNRLASEDGPDVGI